MPIMGALPLLNLDGYLHSGSKGIVVPLGMSIKLIKTRATQLQ